MSGSLPWPPDFRKITGPGGAYQGSLKEDKMITNVDKEEATALAEYEPVASEFRERAHMEWRTEGKKIKLYDLRWKYVRLTMEE